MAVRKSPVRMSLPDVAEAEEVCRRILERMCLARLSNVRKMPEHAGVDAQAPRVPANRRPPPCGAGDTWTHRVEIPIRVPEDGLFLVDLKTTAEELET